MKPVSFFGNTPEVLRSFPEDVRRGVGFQIDRIQRGLNPIDWKPLNSIGPGVREIRVRDATGAYRVVYIATLVDAVYVLHAFNKKTRATSRHDLELATSRLRDLMRRSGR